MTKFTVEKMYRLPDAGVLKAFAEVAINNAIVIHGVRVVQDKKGLSVEMPKEQGKDGKWYDQLSCKNKSVHEDLTTVVLDYYGKV
jgi:DNA-binding cell septation regulator SpoVG